MSHYVHFIGGLGKGGAEYSLLKLIQFSSKLPNPPLHTVVSLTDKPENLKAQFLEANARIVILDLQHFWRCPRPFLALVKALWRDGYDRFDCWMPHAHIFGWLCRFLFFKKVPLVFHIRGGLPKKMSLVARLGRRLSKRADCLSFNAKNACKAHIQSGFTNRKIKIFPNGFDSRILQKNTLQRALFRKQHQLTDDVLAVGVMARFHPVKGFDVAAKAAKIVFESDCNVVFVFAGRGVTENQSLILSNIPESHHKRVIFLPHADDRVGLLSGLDVGLVPSYSESFSNVLAEMMLCELLVLASQVGDAFLLLAPEYLFEKGAYPVLAKKIMALHELPKSQLQAQTKMMRDVIEKNFSMEASWSAFEHLVRDASSKKT